MIDYFRKARVDHSQRKRLQTLAHDVLSLREGETVRVSELACGAPGCPDVVTAVLILRAGCRTDAVHIPKRVADVTETDLLAALSAAAEPPASVILAQALASLGF